MVDDGQVRLALKRCGHAGPGEGAGRRAGDDDERRIFRLFHPLECHLNERNIYFLTPMYCTSLVLWFITKLRKS